MQIEKFIEKYKSFCEVKFGTQTGTAASYANALKYLFEYLGFNDIDENAILTIKSIEPDIRDKHCVFYNNILNNFATNGRTSYVEKGFVKAAIPALYEFLNEQPLPLIEQKEDILIDAVHDSKIVVSFSINKLKRIFPIANSCEHTYELQRVNGTTKDSVKKICSGRKAEKYFISYLRDYLGLEPGVDFIDVSNNKEYGYDIRVFGYGIEVKNIKNGGFYLTDNEIARLEHSETHLILCDIDNGIWLLKNDSKWLKMVISNIKSIRKYCSNTYKTLDLSDIRICLDETINSEVVDISRLNKMELKSLL